VKGVRLAYIGALVLVAPCFLRAQSRCESIPALSIAGAPPESRAFTVAIRQIHRDQQCVQTGPVVNRVRRLIAPLAQLGGELVADTRFVIVDSPMRNAFAVSVTRNGTGLVTMYTGYITYLDSLARAVASDGGGDAQRISDLYVSSVLGHELSHLLLRHTIDGTCNGVRPGVAIAAAAGVEGTRRLVDSVSICATFSQKHELSADSVGAILLVQAYGSNVLGSFGDLVRAWERTDGHMRASGTDEGSGRAVSSHPSAVRRAAALMRIWADYLEQQDRYDAAAILIAANVEVPRALALLDTVSRALPGDPRIAELRAAAQLRQYLSTVPLQTLRLRPVVGVVNERFIEGVKGAADAAGDLALANRAQAALMDLPQLEQRPVSLANLAVLESVTGNAAAAHRHAVLAVAQDPGNVPGHNALALVLLRAGQTDSAFAVLARVLGGAATPVRADRLAEVCTDSTSDWAGSTTCYNAARILFERDRRTAQPILRWYRREYADSPWGRETARVLGEGTQTAVTAVRDGSGSPERTRALPEQLRAPENPARRIVLGASYAEAISLVGSSAQVVRHGDGVFLVNAEERFSVYMAGSSPATARAEVLISTAPGRWLIGGVAPGATLADLIQLFGRPDESNGASVYWRRGDRKFVAVLAGDVVRNLAVAQVTP